MVIFPPDSSLVKSILLSERKDHFVTTIGRKEENVLFNDVLNTFYLLSYGRKEGNVLFNDALNTFYLRLYGVKHMVKDHFDSEKGNSLPPHGLLFQLAARVLLYAPSHRQDSTYHGFCYTSRGALAGTRQVSFMCIILYCLTNNQTKIRLVHTF